MNHVIDGAIINANVIEGLNRIQENKESYLEIIEDLQNLIISENENIQRPPNELMARLGDLNLLKSLLIDISKTSENEQC